MVVNDSKLERQIIRETLLSHMYNVVEVEDGKKALEKLNDSVDLVVLDNIMPGITGYDISMEIRNRERDKHVPIILTSSNDNPVNENRAFEVGCNLYLLKSDIQKKLLSSIEYLQSKKELSNEIKVLIIDDSKAIRSMLNHTFNSEGFITRMANNGKMALEVLKDFTPDFITLDIEMPVMDGFETAEKIRSDEKISNIPIIMISSKDDHETRMEGFNRGVIEFISKPFEPTKLTEYIKDVILQLSAPKHKKVLIIDPSTKDQHIMKYSLQRKGYQVYSLLNGEKSLEYIAKLEPDVILLNVSVGELVGQSIFSDIIRFNENSGKYIPVIFVSNIDNKELLIKGLNLGAIDYLIKPFYMEELSLRVENVLSISSLLKENLNNQKVLSIKQSEINKSRMFKINLLENITNKLQNTLNMIMTFSDELLEDPDGILNNRYLDYIERISKYSNNLLQDTRELNTLNKLEKRELDVRIMNIPINKIVKTAYDIFHSLANKKHLDYSCINCSEDIYIESDPNLLLQIMKNLIEDSILSTDKGKVAISLISNKSDIVIQIEDTGVNIPEEQLKNVFDGVKSNEKYSLLTNEKGIGLSLTIARHLLKILNGDISVENKKDGGCIFEITLPKKFISNDKEK